MPHVRLSDGLTHYELQGHPQGPLLILLHGSSIPLWVWDTQMAALLQAGYRILRYDMYGKGLSDSPRIRYNRKMYANQLFELLEALNLNQSFDLAGFSFGGGLAAYICIQHPTRVRRLILVAPTVNAIQVNPLLRKARIPILGRFFVRWVVLVKMKHRAKSQWSHLDQAEHYQQTFEAQCRMPGFASAFHSFWAEDALGDYRPIYAQLGQLHKAVLLLWGTQDENIPAEHIACVRELLPNVQYQQIQGVGHGIVFEASNWVNQQLIAFLNDAHEETKVKE